MRRICSGFPAALVLFAGLAAGLTWSGPSAALSRARIGTDQAAAAESPWPVSGSAYEPSSDDTVPVTSSYLPVLLRTHRSPAACPFGIEIASLIQVGQDPSVGRILGPGFEANPPAPAEPFPTLLDALRASGACWTRILISWAEVQPEPPPSSYEWDYYDRQLALIAATGASILAIVDDPPEWAADRPCDTIYPDRLPDLAQFLSDLVGRYQRPPWSIHHWEMRNEPDGTDLFRGVHVGGCAGFEGDQYAGMLSWAYPAVKQADPTSTVLLGGLAYDGFLEYGWPFYRYFVDEVMEAGGGAYIDATNFHYFCDWHAEWERWVPDGIPPTCGLVGDGIGEPYEAWGIDLVAKANHLRNRLSTCHGVDLPAWVSELAEHGVEGDAWSLHRQAQYVVKGNVRGLAAGLDKIIWFALVSPPYDPNHQGLLYQADWSPKPAFRSYQVLTSELRGYRYLFAQEMPDVEAYWFVSDPGAAKAVAWGSGSLSWPTGCVRAVDLQGTEILIADGGLGDADGSLNGWVVLAMTDDPLFVQESAGCTAP